MANRCMNKLCQSYANLVIKHDGACAKLFSSNANGGPLSPSSADSESEIESEVENPGDSNSDNQSTNYDSDPDWQEVETSLSQRLGTDIYHVGPSASQPGDFPPVTYDHDTGKTVLLFPPNDPVVPEPNEDDNLDNQDNQDVDDNQNNQEDDDNHDNQDD